ncbi:MAG: DNA-binding transcriptional LysR family regulator [Gammaproteobacteria bacterium]|jgi:DNA-binding transcriptional LysR family regulator
MPTHPDMNLRQLEAFRATMRSGSITGAAKLLYISQPSVSRLIADLEHALGFTLFTRTGHGLVSTVEARRFHHSVESTFTGLDKLRETAEAIRNAQDEIVSLSVIPVFANVIMPEAVARAHHQNSDLQFEVSVRNTSSIVDALLLQQLDLGLICPIRHYEGIHLIYETSLPYRCLLPVSHKLAKKKLIDLKLLTNEEIITLDAITFKHLLEDDTLTQALIRHSHIHCQSIPGICALAASTGLPAIVNSLSARQASQNDELVSLPIKQNLKFPIAIISRSKETYSIAAQILATAIREQLETQSEGC